MSSVIDCAHAVQARPRVHRFAAALVGIGALLVGAGAGAQTIFQEDFAAGIGQFSATGTVTTGTFGVRLRGGSGASITSRAISTQGFSNLVVSFDRTTSGLDAGETAVASFSTNGSTFTPLESVRTASGRVNFNLAAMANNQTQVFLRFQLNASSALETYVIDNIVLRGTTGNPTPTPGGTLPPVNDVNVDGPFSTAVDTATGPTRAGSVFRPTTLGANGLKHPVFIWGPGAGATPASYDFHLRRIASHGFVVYSEVSTGNGSEMRAAIDFMIAENSRAASPYFGKLDTSRIAAGGHSRGSLSTFGVAADPRLTTTIHVAGGSFDGNGPNNLRRPAAYICGENDTTGATDNATRDYARTNVPVFFTVMAGVGHVDAARAGIGPIVGWLRWQIGGEIERASTFLAPNCAFCTGIFESQNKNF
jgi:hypothetical protein